MKKTSLFIFIVFFCLPTFVNASQIISSNITEVTLYSNQAMVVREGSAHLKPGLNVLLFETSAFNIDKDAVSAQVFGKGEMLSVQIKQIPLSDFPQDQVRALSEKLRSLNHTRKGLSNKTLVLAKKEAFLDGLIDFSKTQIPKDVQTRYPNIQETQETLAFIGSTFTTIHTERQALDISLEEIDREIEKVKRELASVSGRTKASKQVIEILFNATRQETLQLRVQYLVKGAFWQPLYKVSAPMDLSAFDLTMFARISQKSGEDWKNVTLSVSNVIPLKGVRIPVVSSWQIDIPRPAPTLLKRSLDKFKTETLEFGLDLDEKTPAAAPPAEYASASANELPLSFEYKMSFPVDIDSREQYSHLPLFTKKLSADTYHYSIPGKTNLTYLVAEATADKELLAGALNVYFDGRFIGDTYLSEKKPGEPFYLNLGADRGVSVQRKKRIDKVKETYFGTLQRNTVVRSFSYKITAENIKNKPVTLKIVDRIPVSRTDKIEVKDIRLSPTPKTSHYQDKEGVHLWEFQLPPGQTQEI
ncbi:MAG: DUF4139 domain-containing protein, partial [Deltaproteobacteria bacterium]|nr:DUF4139 domain-containing protein [Deltaproteobacteria bacterium]